MAVIVVMITFAAVLMKDEYGRFLLSDANYGLQALITEDQNTEDDGVNLFIGSSMFRQGLDIRTMEKQLPGRSYILSYNGNQAFLEYDEIKYLINHHVKIRHIYMDMYAYAMQEIPWVHDEKIFMETDLPFKVSVWQQIQGSGSFGDFWKMFVTSDNDMLLSWPVSYPQVNALFYRGGNITVNGGTPSESFAAEIKTAEGVKQVTVKEKLQAAQLNTLQEEYTKKLIRLCKDHQIEVSYIETPKFILVENDPDYTAIMLAFAQLLEQNQTKFHLTESTSQAMGEAGKFSCQMENIPFDSTQAEYFIDSIHLSSEGRKVYTESMLNTIGGDADAQ